MSSERYNFKIIESKWQKNWEKNKSFAAKIDKHKKRQDSVGSQARSIIRNLDALRDKGSLSKGVRIDKGMGIVRVASYNPLCLPDDLDLEDSDNQIIATALSEQESAPKSRKVVVV